ncbi:MAG TPA: GSCFA domain-containing protein [Chryseosolibacter sp.]|nr:GSCFA domain-containing protein [Chryseosolibacter sp.]
MMKFRTELKVEPAIAQMRLKNGILTQGSCFSDAIGERLATHRLKALVNPFGVIYNPESIHKALLYSIYNEAVPPQTFLKRGELHFSFDFHSEFSAMTEHELSTRLNNAVGATHYFIKEADWLLITYGTAWVYERHDTGEIVANCHKLPAAHFSKSLMNTQMIVSSFARFYQALRQLNSRIRMIITVSPVRHLKDTLEHNSVSKSVLRVACHEIAAQFTDVEYFPAFEMMIDDLRDYRFYKSDMLHPTEQAEDYIWEKFMERYFSPELKEFVKQWGAVLSAVRHKPFHPGTAAHQQFLRETLNKLEALSEHVDVRDEIAYVKANMKTKES